MIYWHEDDVKLFIHKKHDAFLHAAGNLVVNQMASAAHKITGTLANSMMYTMKSGAKSKFLTDNGSGVPPAEAVLGPADSGDVVKCGSALVYAGAQERHNGWATRTLDEIESSGVLETLAAKVFRI